jgi:prepilin-type N-terminal cleavage/methylation domain-containing protein/prepilin-type processing-associated H-X9-DG protein
VIAHCPKPVRFPKPRGRGFTLIELLVTLGLIALLASLLFPALSRAKVKGNQIACLNHLRQLGLAWTLYTHDEDDRLPYNLGATEIFQMLARGREPNWANSVLNWELDQHNTNRLLNTRAALGIYLARNDKVFRCPSDGVVSAIQRGAGWKERSRSFSMNAMVGDAGEFTREGVNVNNPHYNQFLKMSDFRSTTDIFVFIEEHPDSINDGYFLNRPNRREWTDLPASWHNGAANLIFADGHAENRRWFNQSTRKPPRPDGANLPFSIEPDEVADFVWLMRRTSIYEAGGSYSPPAEGGPASR